MRKLIVDALLVLGGTAQGQTYPPWAEAQWLNEAVPYQAALPDFFDEAEDWVSNLVVPEGKEQLVVLMLQMLQNNRESMITAVNEEVAGMANALAPWDEGDFRFHDTRLHGMSTAPNMWWTGQPHGVLQILQNNGFDVTGPPHPPVYKKLEPPSGGEPPLRVRAQRLKNILRKVDYAIEQLDQALRIAQRLQAG